MLVQNNKGEFFDIPEEELNKYRVSRPKLSADDLGNIGAGFNGPNDPPPFDT